MVGEKGERAGAGVTDLKNGSYEVSFTCLWPGATSKVGYIFCKRKITLALVKLLTNLVVGPILDDRLKDKLLKP